jgi:hypothetical protein
VAQTLLIIYRAGSVTPQEIVVSVAGGAFQGPAGKWNSVCRVDFYQEFDGTNPPQVTAIVPCDPSHSVVEIDGTGVYVQLNLAFTYLLGTPTSPSGMNAKLWFTSNKLIFQSGMVLDGTVLSIEGDTGWETVYDYSGVFAHLRARDTNTTQLGADPLSQLPDSWPSFAFGTQLMYAVRDLSVPGQTALSPVFTLERQIPAVHNSVLRHLPAPFSIAIGLDMPGSGSQLQPLVAVQFPRTDWLSAPQSVVAHWLIDVNQFQPGTIASFWRNIVVNRYLGAMQSVSDGEVVSMLPDFAGTLPDGDWRLQLPVPSSDGAPSLQLLGPLGNAGPSSNGVEMICDGFLSHVGKGLSFNAAVVNVPYPLGAWPQLPWIRFNLTGVALEGGDPGTSIRLGSLDLGLENPVANSAWLSCTVSFEAVTSDFWLPRINLIGTLPVSSITPGGQDYADDPILDQLNAALQAAGNPCARKKALVPQYTHEPAAVVPVILPSTGPATAPPTLTMSLSESSVKGQNQQFSLTVMNEGGGSGVGTNLLVIDRNPFTIVYVQLPDLAAAASAATSQIAQWSNSFPEGSGWRISAGAASFGFQLPPQGVGEAMVTANTNPQDEPVENSPIDFRLTPPTQFVVAPSGEPQLFAEPGWNMRNIAGYPGERAPGIGVVSVLSESVYGLTCTVTTGGLNVSEMFSRLGGFAGPLVDSTTGSILLALPAGYTAAQAAYFDSLNDQWGALYSQLLSRLGVFELWNQESGFDLQLSDGVSYELRASSYDAASPASFAGGVAYALFVEDLLDLVQKTPISSSALLRDPRFSALGAYVGQRASFQHDNIIVEADVAMGLLNTLSVTVIGRIGNFWHHAKHVTVYERSVRPSRQFYLQQLPLEGRPILRKVSEYIEITQKIRSYPESGAPISCGFVQGVEFKSVRINVDSAWAMSVPGASGQKIPLWRRDAAPSDVYPRPQILIQFATDPATGSGTATSEILDPDKLCFWGDPNQVTSDTDLWAPVAYVDYCVMPPSRTIAATPVANDYTVELGFGRFSYSVAADASNVNVVSQRATNAMSSALRSVSFMRAQNNTILPSSVQQSAGVLHDYVNNTLDELVTAAQSGTAPVTAITSRLAALKTDLVDPFKTACAAVSGISPASVCSTLSQAASAAIQQAGGIAEGLFLPQLTAAQNQMLATANAAQPTTASLKQALLAEVNSVYLELKNVTGVLLYDLGGAQALSTRANSVVTTTQAALTSLSATVTSTSVTDSAFVKAIGIELARYQGDLDATLDDIQQLLTAADLLLGAQTSNLDGLVDVRTALASWCDALSGDFSTVSQQLLNPVADAINETITSITTQLKLTDLQSALGELTVALASVTAGINPIAAYLTTLHDALYSAINSVSTTVVSDYVTAINLTFTNTVLGDFDTAVQQASNIVAAQVSAVCAVLLGNFSNTLKNTIADFLDSSAITDALGALTDAADCVDALEALRTSYIAQLDGVAQQCLVALPALTAPTTGLSLLRAFGAPPQVPGLTFDTGAIAYFYNTITNTASQAGETIVYDLVQEVPVSAGLQTFVSQASSALVDAGNQLKQLGIGNLPTWAVLDRLVPNPDLSNLQLSDIFPNLAGLSLANLFSGVTMPTLASNNIHISHSFDPQTLRASLDIALNFPLDDSATTLFSIGPATVTIENCVFQAAVHVAGAPGQSGSRTSSGSITGDWNVVIGGTEIISFVSTALTFDEAGHLHFDIQPARVRLAAVLQFLADFVEGLDLGGGFTLNLLPSGIQCLLELPFPDMSAGAFGISNLSLGCSFELDISPDFAITVGANLGLEQAPFTLTIFVLGGAGWFNASVTYTPDTGQLTADVSIGIMASASLSISLGPISGGVYIYFGITADFHTGSGLELGILLMIQGRVSLLGIVDIDITLLMEAEYVSGGGLIGRGEVDASIKICWCFTLEVHKSVEYRFGSSSSSTAVAHAAVRTASLAPRPRTLLAAASVPSQTFAQSASNRINFLT